LKQFHRDLQARFEHLEDSELSGGDYLTKILGDLAALAGEREDDDRRRAMRAALYETERGRDETLTQSVVRREQQFLQAQLHGITVPTEMRGLLLEEGAALTKQGRQNLRTFTAGSTDSSSVARALRNLALTGERLLGSGSSAKQGIWAAAADDEDDDGNNGEEEACLIESLSTTFRRFLLCSTVCARSRGNKKKC
jgi:hypothetical protein